MNHNTSSEQSKKKYRFDYIREEVMEWHPDVRKKCTLSMVRGVGSLVPPWIMPGEYIPARDRYGDEVYNISDWYSQKDEYCKELYHEICSQRSWIDNFNVQWDRFLFNIDISLSFGLRTTIVNMWLWIKNKFSNHENDGKF